MRFRNLLPYRFAPTRQPGDDASMRLAFTTEMLPAQTPIGPGIVPNRTLAATQPAQSEWYQTVTPAGLGGIVAGQIVFQPLWDNTILPE